MPTFPLHLEPSPLLVDPPLPREPALQAEVESMIARMKLSIVMACSGRLPRSPSGVDLVNQRFVASRTPQARKLYAQKATTILNNETLRRQQFGEHAEISPAEYQKLGYPSLAQAAELARFAALATVGRSFLQWWVNKQKQEAWLPT